MMSYDNEPRPKIRKTPWTKRRLDAVINAVTAMLAGEEGEGDWAPDNKAEDLRAGLNRLIEGREGMRCDENTR